jgi:hypothetical protein
MDFNEIKLYGKKSMADVFKEIHQNTQNKEEELQKLIYDLKPYIKSAGDAVIVVPLISKYLEISVKNNDNLIKMVGIVQRAINASTKGNENDLQLTEQEKEELLKNIQNLQVV